MRGSPSIQNYGLDAADMKMTAVPRETRVRRVTCRGTRGEWVEGERGSGETGVLAREDGPKEVHFSVLGDFAQRLCRPEHVLQVPLQWISRIDLPQQDFAVHLALPMPEAGTQRPGQRSCARTCSRSPALAGRDERDP